MQKARSTTIEIPSTRVARGKRFVIQEIGPSSWADVEKALGQLGCCGGCWCSFWRLGKGEKAAAVRGVTAKRRLRKGVLSGSVHGLVAYFNGDPVGWCTFGPRKDFPRLDQSSGRRNADQDGSWTIPCFFVQPGYRELGVSSALLVQALRILRDRKIKVVEGYPLLVPQASEFFPEFTCNGALTLCLKAGFNVVDRRDADMARDGKYTGIHA
jgi:GNAT superfamily N-acetyltransferase